jgi:acyl-CoA thioester hydrolase
LPPQPRSAVAGPASPPEGPPRIEDALGATCTLQSVVEPRFIDAMGHMNTTWYMFLFDRASWAFLAGLGLDDAHMERTGSGAFAVEQRMRYFAELRLGDRVAIHTRLTQTGTRSMRFTHTMVDVERQRVAATIENVAVLVDRATRKAIAFPDALLSAARRLLDEGAPVRAAGG